MTASADFKTLPAQARKRIEQLENTVIELSGALGQVVSQMNRQGMAVSLKRIKSPALKAIFQRVEPEPRPDRNSPRKAPARSGAAGRASATGLGAALARGEAAKVEWVRSGEVVPAKTLAECWGLTPQALGPAAQRGELFSIVVKRQRHYPREFLGLDREDVATVTKSLGRLGPEEKLMFWKRPHGALGGKTVFESLSDKKRGPQLVRVVQLAQSWAAQAEAEADAAETA